MDKTDAFLDELEDRIRDRNIEFTFIDLKRNKDLINEGWSVMDATKRNLNQEQKDKFKPLFQLFSMSLLVQELLIGELEKIRKSFNDDSMGASIFDEGEQIIKKEILPAFLKIRNQNVTDSLNLDQIITSEKKEKIAKTIRFVLNESHIISPQDREKFKQILRSRGGVFKGV